MWRQFKLGLRTTTKTPSARDRTPYPASPLEFGSAAVESATKGLEDRNRTAPFPFCGNRYEFRAVGSSQSVAQPMAYLNAAMAEGCAAVSSKIEAGASPRDAIAQTYDENMRVIFNGNGYGAEWPVEAASRGLANLTDTPSALAHFASDKNKAMFVSQVRRRAARASSVARA